MIHNEFALVFSKYYFLALIKITILFLVFQLLINTTQIGLFWNWLFRIMSQRVYVSFFCY